MQLRIRTPLLPLAALAVLAGSPPSASAQIPWNTNPALDGDIVGTCHSGYPYDAADNTHYVVSHMATADTSGASLAGPSGGVDWSPTKYHGGANANERWSVANLGEVFGLALDGATPPNIFVSASTVYGQFPAGPGGPGAVYRLNQGNGSITTFATLPNAGPMLGNMAYDPVNNQLFVSNFEDGLIYRLNATTGAVLGTAFDHGVDGRPFAGQSVLADSGTLGDFTALERRIWGLGVYESRLYYSVWREDLGCHPSYSFVNPLRVCPDVNTVKNEIWSIAIGPDFDLLSPQREFELPPLPTAVGLVPADTLSNPVSDITFSQCGAMILAERTRLDDVGRLTVGRPLGPWDAYRARVLEYTQLTSGGTWLPSPTDKYRVGYVATLPNSERTDSAGGVAVTCNGDVWSTGDALHLPAPWVYGAQRIPAGGNAGLSIPPNETSYIVDFDGLTSAPSFNKTGIGDVEVYAPACACDCLQILSDDVQVVPGTVGEYTYTATFKNHSSEMIEHVVIAESGPESISPNYVSFVDTPIPPLGTATVQVTITNAGFGEVFCFLLSVHNDLLEECCSKEICRYMPIPDVQPFPDTCHATKIVPCCPGTQTGLAEITICNNSFAPRTYTWLMLPTNIPGAFTPPNGTAVNVPAQECVTIPVTVDCTLVPGTTQYGFAVTGPNFADRRCWGLVRNPSVWSVKAVSSSSLLDVAYGGGGGTLLPFEVENIASLPGVFDYKISDFGLDGGAEWFGVSLDGLPPGQPVTGSVSIPLGGTQTIFVNVDAVDASLEGLIEDIFLLADDDGDGFDEPLASQAIRHVAGNVGTIYCMAGITSLGCSASISGVGTPSASAATPYDVTISGVDAQRSGLVFYGLNGPASIPWGGSSSFLCVKAPVQRTPSGTTGGTAGTCDGSFAYDFNARIQSGIDPGLFPGAVVNTQFWFRDPPSPNTTHLSDGLEFTVLP